MRARAGEMGVTDVQDLVGQANHLVQVSHHDRLDLTGLLTPARERLMTAPEGQARFFREFHPPPPHRAPEIAAERLAAGSALAVEEETTTAADRNLGTDLAGMIARSHTHVNTSWNFGALAGDGNAAAGQHGGNPNILADAEHGGGDAPMVDLAFTKGAAAGSGLGAFNIGGVRMRVFGGAQDGVGKCSLGGEIQVLKAQNKYGDWVGGHVGKSFAYGAQRGLFLIQGDTDARAGIRLSGADMVLGGEPREPLHDRSGSLAARANCKGFAFEYMTGGRVVVLGDPGPWICSGMTGGVIYCRQHPDWNLDGAAIRRRLSKTAKVSMLDLDDSDEAQVAGLLTKYRQALVESGQDEAASKISPLIDAPAEHFITLSPVTQQADPNISTE
jgi:glutamate synthase (NADPH/NADH) large chain